ncbi:hypothetical protein PHYBOEH_000501 [Phytophthora boehmeriae]|uniref:Mitochondrial Carrier (MC) Family n=1 Tax=Phytophthora boehmeriae TaxID=109152 RepID=A0A8T1WZB4_9STRA|nr:hypothetical protein PHYBOEH_000501 [Phytophthora boehmeriae]
MASAAANSDGKRGASASQAALAGAVSGGVTRLVAAPLDLIKIRFQVQPAPIANGHAAAKYSGLLQAVRSIYAEEGLRSFWRGNLAASGLWIGYSTIQFGSYRVLTACWERHGNEFDIAVPRAIISATNGALAGIAATVATYPLDLFRTAFAGQGMPKRFPTMRSLATHMWTTQGTRGFYSGLGSTVFQIVPYAGLSFGIYSTLNELAVDYCNEKKGSNPQAWMSLSTALSYVGSGAVAGLVSKLAVYPLDTVKKRMQMRHVPRCETYGVIPEYSSGWRCFFDVLRYEGVRGLYKGTVPSLIKSVVGHSCSFATYEMTLEVLRHLSMHEDQ